MPGDGVQERAKKRVTGVGKDKRQWKSAKVKISGLVDKWTGGRETGRGATPLGYSPFSFPRLKSLSQVF